MKHFPCKCGHDKQWHLIGVTSNLNTHCVDLTSESSGYRCWHIFVPDNLKYLEQLYEKETKSKV